MQKQKKFISIIWGYHKQIFSFQKEQNYHMLPLEVMKEEGFDCEIFAIDSQVKIEEDPNFIKGTKIIYYSSFLGYIIYLYKNRNEIIYSNSLTIRTLLVGLIGKKTVFMPHDQALPLKEKIIKRQMVLFFYHFFSCIRAINKGEVELLSQYGISVRMLPLVISGEFYSSNPKRSDLVFVGNLYHDKNPEFLLSTLALLIKKHPTVQLHIFGEDRYDKNGKNFATILKEAGLNEHITIHGFAPHKELLKALSERQIYINTSISEGQCLTVYEAALSGCILCLQQILAFPSVFGSNALYHVTPFDLANNIDKILSNPSLFYESIDNNQKMIREKYNIDFLKKETKNLFLDIYLR